MFDIDSSFKTSIVDLPFEVLDILMSYLNPGQDRRNAGLVCKTFLDAADRQSDLTLNLNYCKLDDSCPPVNLFLKSTRPYRKLIFGGDVEFGECLHKFSEKFGSSLKEITFDYCPGLTVEILSSILRHMKCLQKLQIYCRKDFFLMGSKIVDDTNFDDLSMALQTVTNLNINGTNISATQFENLVQLLPNLEAISLFFCNDLEELAEGEHYLSCTELVNFIKERSRKIKEISLDDFGYQILNEDKLLSEFQNENLRLTKICFPMEENGSPHLEAFLDSQKSLLILGTKSVGLRISADNINILCRKATNVRELCIRDAFGRIQGLDFLASFDQMHTFRLMNYTNSLELEDGLHVTQSFPCKPQMRCFELSCACKICDCCFTRLAKSFSNLTTLKLPQSKINDCTLQVIFFNMRSLRKLCLSGCRNITDIGMIGWREQNEATQTKAMMQDHSIANLRGLRSLDISGCEEITNVSFLNSFRFPELQKLRMSNLKRVSILGIESLVQGCGALEILDLGGCESINDACVKLLALKLNRLKWLDLHGCKALTELAWQQLQGAQSLQNLNCWNCDFTIFLSDLLFSRVESLKLIYYERKDRRLDYEKRVGSLL